MWARDEYLTAILQLDTEAHYRIAMAEDFIRSTLQDAALKNVFVGNAVPGPDGSKLGGLWYFTDLYRINVGDFMTRPTTVAIGRAGPIERLGVLFDQWDPGSPTDESQMQVTFHESFGANAPAGNMAARGRNCTQLYDLVKEFLVPRMRLI